jgi:hypothetical protein
MAKIGRHSSSGKFTVQRKLGKKPATIRSKETGKVYTLKGYGALKGKYVVKKGINLTKPIARQASKTAARNASKA